MNSREELTELLADIKVIHDELNDIYYNQNPLGKFKRLDEIMMLEKLLNDRIVELLMLRPSGKTIFYS